MHFATGTIVTRAKGVFTHVGIVTERGTIFHNTPERGEHESLPGEFAAGETLIIRGRALDLTAFLNRLHVRRHAPQAYDAVSNNCEHTVAALVVGQPRSEQAAAALLLIAVAGIAFMLLRQSA